MPKKVAKSALAGVGIKCFNPKRRSTMNDVLEVSVQLNHPVFVGLHYVQETTFTRPTVEDNLRLAYSSALSFLKSNEDVESSDEYSYALEGLWRAVSGWEKKRSIESHCSWPTYAIGCMRNAIIGGLRRCKELQEELVDFTTHQPEAPQSFSPQLADMFARHPDDKESDIQSKRVLYDYYIVGKTLQEIGKEFGFTKEWAWQLVRRAEKLLRERFGGAT